MTTDDIIEKAVSFIKINGGMVFPEQVYLVIIKETRKEQKQKDIKDEIRFLKSAWRLSKNMNVFDKIRKRLDKQTKGLALSKST